MDSADDLQAYVQLHALKAGHLTLPERFFVHPSSNDVRRTVPSLSFLIQHTDPKSAEVHRIVFDLGLRHPTTKYPKPVQNHIATRQPLTTHPDILKSLEFGGLSPDDIDIVIYSHIHWDHIGDPSSFPKTIFVVGPGSTSLLGNTSLPGGHSFFEADLLPPGRTIELPPDNDTQNSIPADKSSGRDNVLDFNQPWRRHGSLPRTMDIFQDGSVLVVDAPGHLPGHINLLVRIGPAKYVYLAGDACHDRRLMTGERQIAEWLDEKGHTCCIHVDKEEAMRTIERIRVLEAEGVEIIFAHDIDWEENPNNEERFWGAN